MKSKITPKNTSKDALWGFAYLIKNDRGSLKLRLRWLKIGITSLALLLSAWIMLATALFLTFKYVKKYENISFSSMFFALLHLDEHRKKMGDYQIGKSEQLFKDGKHLEGYTALRQGVRRSPANKQGIQTLAEIYESSFHRPDLALALYERSLPFLKDDPDYIESYMQILDRNQADEKIINITQALLNQAPQDSKIEKSLAYYHALALYNQGFYRKAQILFQETSVNLENETRSILLKSQINGALDCKEKAIQELEAAMQRFPQNGNIYKTLLAYYLQNQAFDKARLLAVNMNVHNPLSIEPRTDLLYILHEKGQIIKPFHYNNLIQDFSQDYNEMLALADFSIEIKHIQLAEALYENAIEQNMPLYPFIFTLIQTYLSNDYFQEAIQFIDNLKQDKNPEIDAHKTALDGFYANAYYGLGNEEATETCLKKFLFETNINYYTLITIYSNFIALQNYHKAHSILEHALFLYPNENVFWFEKVKTELLLCDMGSLRMDLPYLLSKCRPNLEKFREIHLALKSDSFIYLKDQLASLEKIEKITKKN